MQGAANRVFLSKSASGGVSDCVTAADSPHRLAVAQYDRRRKNIAYQDPFAEIKQAFVNAPAALSSD